MSEAWKPVVGFEGLYEVSNLGRVRSLARVAVYQRRDQYSGKALTIKRSHASRLLRPGKTSSGHLTVCLGRGEGVSVHRLVLEAFVGPCPEGHEGLHWDDQPDNNALSNLRWGTRGDNLRDAIRNGKKAVGEALPQTKLRASDIPVIRRRLLLEGPVAIARTYGVNETTIRQVRDGQSWKHVPCT